MQPGKNIESCRVIFLSKKKISKQKILKNKKFIFFLKAQIEALKLRINACKADGENGFKPVTEEDTTCNPDEILGELK